MNKDEDLTTVEIMGKSYQIKCAKEEVTSLHTAAAYLQNKMSQVRDTGRIIGVDRIAVITALNIAHQFLNIEDIIDERNHDMQQRLRELHQKIDLALSDQSQLELSSAE